MKNKLLIFLIFPVLLFLCISLIFSLRILSTNFTPRMYFYEQGIKNLQYGERSVKFTVPSKENFLGIVTIDHINNLIPISTDTLRFQIRNLSTGNQIGSNTYEVDNVFYFDSIPFGFEVQADSGNQEYQIELIASCSTLTCTFGPIDSTVTLRHYFPKSLIFSDPILVFHFLSEKLIVGIRQASFADTWQLFIIPIALYFVIVWMISDHSKTLLTLLRKIDIPILILIFIDVLLQNSVYFWISLPIVIYRCRSKASPTVLVLVSVTFVITVGLYLSGLNLHASRMGMWMFVFVAISLLNLTTNK